MSPQHHIVMSVFVGRPSISHNVMLSRQLVSEHSPPLLPFVSIRFLSVAVDLATVVRFLEAGQKAGSCCY